MDAREQQLDSDEAQNAIPLETCIDIPFKVRGDFISDPSLHREVGDFLDQGALAETSEDLGHQTDHGMLTRQ